LRNEDLGQADVLVHHNQGGNSVALAGGLTSITAHIRSSSVSDLISDLLGKTVVTETAAEAADILRNHPEVTVVTRDGDFFTKSRARGGSKNTNSLIEVKALIEKLRDELQTITNECDRLKFAINSAAQEIESKQSAFDAALSKLNESDARIAAITEQLAVAGQHMKSATAEVERLNSAIAETTTSKSRDEGELIRRDR
jgi:chromosome segregation protein